MAKKKCDQLMFCCDFRYLNFVTVKDAYPIPRIDESLSKLGAGFTEEAGSTEEVFGRFH